MLAKQRRQQDKLPITQDNLRAQDFIGIQLTVTSANDPTLKDLTGTIRDETRNTLRVEAHGKLLTLPKAGTIFNLRLDNGNIFKVNGNEVIYRPEDRVKKGLARW